MTVRIPLTAGMFALVDDDDAGSISQFRWCMRDKGRNQYAYRDLPRGADGPRSLSMHKFLTGWSYVDHRNGNGLDNRRENLRAATRSQNMGNQRKVRGSCPYKGVSWIARSKVRPWHAQIQAFGKRHHLGYFATAEDAALAYDAAARRLFGPFAALNLPGEGERSALEPALPIDGCATDSAPIVERPPLRTTRIVLDEAEELVPALIAARLRVGWSRRKVAGLIGVAESSLSYWESGRRNPRESVAVRWAAVLGEAFPRQGQPR